MLAAPLAQTRPGGPQGAIWSLSQARSRARNPEGATGTHSLQRGLPGYRRLQKPCTSRGLCSRAREAGGCISRTSSMSDECQGEELPLYSGHDGRALLNLRHVSRYSVLKDYMTKYLFLKITLSSVNNVLSKRGKE